MQIIYLQVYRQLWFALRERVTALDELEMCTTRLRLRYPGEIVEESQLHIIDPVEVRRSVLLVQREINVILFVF